MILLSIALIIAVFNPTQFIGWDIFFCICVSIVLDSIIAILQCSMLLY